MLHLSEYINNKNILILIFKICFFSFFGLAKSLEEININWELIDDGGKIIKLSDSSYNLTHLRGSIGDVMLVSVETFKISENYSLEWLTTFMIIDVVDPSGEKTYGMAETRQRIVLVDSDTYNSILPFDFGFFEATH
ncbi:MAG: hypothetical protein QXS69_03485, partial [Candidatus Aenigmatarchaeota archaeon]